MGTKEIFSTIFNALEISKDFLDGSLSLMGNTVLLRDLKSWRSSAPVGRVERLLYFRCMEEKFGALSHSIGVEKGLRSLGVEVVSISLNSPFKLDGVLKSIRFDYLLRKNLRRVMEYVGDIDLVYQRITPYSLFGVFLAKELEVPLVSEYHGSRWISTRLYKGKSIPFEFISRRIERVNLESSSLISTVSSVLKRDLISFGINSEKIIVNRNCVDLDLFNPDVSPLIQKESGKIRIGFSGIFSKWYGLRTLLRALFSIRREYHGKVDFLLLGDGPLFDSVKKRVSGMREFLLPGWVDLPEVPRYLISCDILVSPNEPIGELRGSPVKIPEYMALGKAVVASRTGDIPEIIGDSGVLFTPGDYVDLRDKISYLIENEEERRKLGKRAWKRVRKNYTWEKYAERLMESIKKIGGGSGKE